MSVLETVFLQLLRMAGMALPVMAVVLALRFILRRAPRKYSYALWAVVGFRLVCPVTLSLPVSIFNLRSLEPAAEQAASIGGGTFSAVTPAVTPSVVMPRIANTAPLPPIMNEPGGGAAAVAQTTEFSALTVASVLWLAGAALLLGWLLTGLFRLRRQVAQAVRQDADVWECDGIPTPFVLGLFRPRIYIPFHLGEEERRYVLSHERCHIRRRDYLVKPLALLILVVYWWNPAVWLCWVLFCRDMEMRCDEAVLEELGDEVKTGYSASLLSFALDRRIPMALAFGEHDASRRVKHVLDWKRARPAVVFLALTAVVLTAVVCGTNARTPEKSRVQIATAENGITFSAKLHSSVQSWAIYEDIYDRGALISSRPIVETGDEPAADWPLSDGRIEILRNTIMRDSEDSGIDALDCTLSANGVFHYLLELPKEHYTGMGSFSGGSISSDETIRPSFFGDGRYEIDPDGEVLLYTVLLSMKEDGGVTVPRQNREAIAGNDTVVQFRLITSTKLGWFKERETSGEPETAEPEIVPEELLGLLPKQYMFTSGAGGWRTMLYLEADGSFTGDYIDMDMGSMEAWGCNFHGRFALPEKVDPYCWRLGIEELTVTGLKDGTEVGDTYVEDGTRYMVTEPYGLNDADELLVYLPGVATASLPEGFFNWARGWGWCLPDYYESGFPAIFPFYGLYNPAEEQGWVAVTEDESYAVYVDFRTDGVTNTASQLYFLKNAYSNAQMTVDYLAMHNLWDIPTLPEHISTHFSLSTGELSVTVKEMGMALGWDELTVLAGNNAAMLLALRGELTKVGWQVQRGGKTLTVALSREEESWLLQDLKGTRAALMEYGETRNGIQELIGLLKRGAPRFNAVMTEPFRDVLGYDGHIETETMGFWQMRTYYAETADGAYPIAKSFGFGDTEDYRVDLDGDGQEELVCNVTFGADGARRAYVYQRRADGIYLGTLSTEGLPNHFDWGVNSWWEEYDPAENVFRLHYAVGDGSNESVLETHGLERMEFQPYNE